MKSFPHFTQHDQMDCGPTCLRMIAAFYGKHYTLNEMREISFITHLFLTQSIVDFGINNQNLNFIYLILLAQLMLSFSSSAVEFIRGWILLHLGTRISIALILDFLIKLMKLPMGYFDTKMTGDILQRINDHTRIQNFLTGSSLSVVFSTFNIVVFGVVLLLYNWMIFFIFMGGNGLYIACVWLFMKKRAELDHKRFAQQSANQSTVVQLVNIVGICYDAY